MGHWIASCPYCHNNYHFFTKEIYSEESYENHREDWVYPYITRSSIEWMGNSGLSRRGKTRTREHEVDVLEGDCGRKAKGGRQCIKRNRGS